MILGPLGQAMVGGDGNAITMRLSYNSRQRKPSVDNDSDTSIGGSTDMEGPGADEYKFTATSHPYEVLQGLDELRRETNFCDVTIAVDGVKFPAHKCVLASFSPYFKAMFTSRLAESRQSVVSVRGIESGMMSVILDYAYTSSVVITRNNVQSLLAAANLLQVMPVKEAACTFLYRHMDASNCIGIHCFAEVHACKDLEVKACKYALHNFSEVSMSEEILSLPWLKLVQFIANDDLEVEKEETVFQTAIRWYNHCPSERLDDFPKVLENVRLCLISPYFLHDCVENQLVIRQSAECRTIVEEAKTYHMLPDRRSQLVSPRARHRNSAGTVHVVVAVGGEDDKVVLRSVECYEPISRKWQTLSCLPFAVSKHGLVASGSSQLYLAGGEFPDGSASRCVFRYDPVHDDWQEMASMTSPRSELGLAMLDGCVYAVGGWEGTYRLDSVERYDPECNVWQPIKPMKMAVTSPAVVAHDGMLYVTGGAVLEDGDGIELVQRYDPKTDCWTELAPMLIPRSGSAACVLGKHIYVLGGWHASTENTNKVERYDVQNNMWEFQEAMCERRYRPGVAVIDRKIYVLGGEEGWDRYHDTIECYSADTNSWEVIGDLPTSRSWLSCVPVLLKQSSLPD